MRTRPWSNDVINYPEQPHNDSLVEIDLVITKCKAIPTDIKDESLLVEPRPLVENLSHRQLHNKTKFRYVCITCNIPPEWSVYYFKDGWNTLPSEFQFFIYSLEKGENTERLHIQGYAEFKKFVNLEYLNRCFPFGHFEVRRGSQKQAIEYCCKSDTHVVGPWVYGQPIINNEKNVFKTVCRELVDGLITIENVKLDYPDIFARHYNGFKALTTNCNPRDFMTKFIVFHGEPGTYKSRLAIKFCEKNKFTYYKLSINGWFDGYRGEDVVIIDEINNLKNGLYMIQNMIDQSSFKVEYKGGMVEFRSKYVIGTTNHEICSWFKGLFYEEDIKSVKRRIFAWYDFKHTGTDEETGHKNVSITPLQLPAVDIIKTNEEEVKYVINNI